MGLWPCISFAQRSKLKPTEKQDVPISRRTGQKWAGAETTVPVRTGGRGSGGWRKRLVGNQGGSQSLLGTGFLTHHSVPFLFCVQEQRFPKSELGISWHFGRGGCLDGSSSPHPHPRGTRVPSGLLTRLDEGCFCFQHAEVPPFSPSILTQRSHACPEVLADSHPR